MRPLLALGALLVWLAGPLPVWGQAATPRSRPAAPSSREAPATSRPKPADPLAKPAGDDKSAPVTVDADQLENRQKEGLIVFTGNVVASQNNSTHYADRMEVYLDAKGESIVRTISTGNVKIITRDCRMGTARRAEYYDAEQRVVLIGNARVWREDNVVTGERITIYLAEDRSVVEGGKQARVKAVFYPKNQEPDQKADARPAAAVPCG
ncbi:MAG TPA: lipopolysaccharide transport periplasmic protein LptA [Methylomirabilota bacterium]|jgi:lipopolysaccharide export system protein LptA|nr:lipopolysaccharide transport periplasmic protein LptA [Methylomirabilota bacterium]